MILLRWLVGLVAALICLAGLGWYAVYLLTPDPRSARGRASTTPSNTAPPTAYERRQNKRSFGLGVAAAFGGLALTVQAVGSIRTGAPIQVLNEPPMNGWVALAVAIFIVFLGLWLASSSVSAQNSD